MTRRAALGPALALMALVACGSDDDGLFDGGSGGVGGASGAGGDAGSALGGSSGQSTTGGSSGASGSAGLAGASGAAGESGSAGSGGEAGANVGGAGGSGGSGGGSTPGMIACGAVPCGTNFNVCCTCPNCPIPYPTTCFPKITGCTGTGKLMTCDDAADCNGGVCCAHYQLPKYEFTGATCEASCPEEGNAQLCSVNDECPVDTVCKPLASLPGFDACQPK